MPSSLSSWRPALFGGFGVVFAVIFITQSSTLSPTLRSFAHVHELNTVANVEHPYDPTNITMPPHGVFVPSGGVGGEGSVAHDAAVGADALAVHTNGTVSHVDGEHGDVLLAATPVPDVAVESSAELRELAEKRARSMAYDSCDWPALASVAKLEESNGTWSYPDHGRSFCGGRHNVSFPIDGPQILHHFHKKKIVFMGDSVARNSFVLTMARMCNPHNYDKCLTRCPTVEFDVANPPDNRGPMGCVPNATSPTAKSPCYEKGMFANVPLKGLTLRSVPQDRNGRRNFIRKGLIGPVMAMHFGDVTLLYHPVTKPNQLTRTGLWMSRHPKSLLHGDVIIVSIGPHLKLPEIQQTPTTLIEGLTALRSACDAPIIAAEFVHALGVTPAYVKFVDELMDTLRKKMTPLGVSLVPQRFVTQHGFMLSSGKVSKSEAPGTIQKGCGYYDPQHPALRCQMTTSDLLLGAAMIRAEQQSLVETRGG